MLKENWICLLQVTLLLQYCDMGEIKHHPAWDILDGHECGESAADRIIGGENAGLGQFPWIIRLGYSGGYENKFKINDISLVEYVSVEGMDEELDWMCGGVLVSNQHVVTAAHCVDLAGQDIFLRKVRMGEYDSRTNPDCQLGVCAPPIQDRGVKKIWIHENYQKPPFHNDIAVLKLDRPVLLNDYVVPICLPRDEEQTSPPHVGEFITLSGWGITNMTSGIRANIAQYITVPIVDPSLCDHFGKKFNISASELCAGAQKDKDSCNGDSGGPAIKVFDTPEGPKNVLIGVVSFGPSHCGIKKPGVYTSVPYFLEWILDHIII